MNYHLDYELKGHAMVFDGPLDLVKSARKATEGAGDAYFKGRMEVNWPGRKGNSWADLERFVQSPWPEAAKLVKGISDNIRKNPDLPLPPDVKRKGRWSEDDGEVDVDRVLRGEPEYMRQTRRAHSFGPTHLALLGNLDLGNGDYCNASGVFFRSACCIALADVLEDLGYSVEIWVWSLGKNVYPDPYHHQFTACRPKEAGQPVDFHAICDTMSAWFTTHAVFGTFNACPVAPISGGSQIEEKYGVNGLEGSSIGPWYKYLGIDSNCHVMTCPMIRSWSVGSGYKQAEDCAFKILEQMAKGR